jgi:hypothetical protein
VILVRSSGSFLSIEASTMRLPPDITSSIEPNVPAGSASSGHVTSRKLSVETCVPKRIGPAAMTMVRVATGFAFGCPTLRDSSA